MIDPSARRPAISSAHGVRTNPGRRRGADLPPRLEPGRLRRARGCLHVAVHVPHPGHGATHGSRGPARGRRGLANGLPRPPLRDRGDGLRPAARRRPRPADGDASRDVGGPAPTGNRIDVEHMFFLRFSEGRVAEVWEMLDGDALRSQLSDGDGS
ncbi:MAG: ester cyclase [Acidimicrobiia bacterium]|nr:ester cyclase [Acidimicrobiia bacterium]